MKKLIDANVILRFFLKDDEKHYAIAEKILKDASKGKVIVTLLAITVFEVIYVLEKKYVLPRADIGALLKNFLSHDYINVPDLDVLDHTLGVYKKTKIDLQDIYLHFYAQKYGLEILSFDNDFTKLQRFLSS